MANQIQITCPWCRTQYTGDIQSNCRNCGGPLPLIRHDDRGPQPPQTPRQMPASFKQQVLLWKNLYSLIGLVFLIVGIPLLAAFGAGLIFMCIGYFMFRHGRKMGRLKLLALEQGHACEGSIIEIYKDSSQSSNGRHPYVIVYKFIYENREQVDKSTIWDESVLLRSVGDPLWIVYTPLEGGASSTWPPMA